MLMIQPAEPRRAIEKRLLTLFVTMKSHLCAQALSRFNTIKNPPDQIFAPCHSE